MYVQSMFFIYLRSLGHYFLKHSLFLVYCLSCLSGTLLMWKLVCLMISHRYSKTLVLLWFCSFTLLFISVTLYWFVFKFTDFLSASQLNILNTFSESFISVNVNFFMELQLTYDIILVSSEQQNDSIFSYFNFNSIILIWNFCAYNSYLFIGIFYLISHDYHIFS